jgi:hypothetical protein
MSLTKLCLAGNTFIIPGQGRAAGDGKIVNLFLQWRIYFQHFEETLEIVHSGLVSACRRFQRIKQRSLQLTDITHKLDKESPNHL